MPLKQSQQDYQKEAKNVSRELTSGMIQVRETLQRGQRAQRRDSKNANREILAALRNSKSKRITELKQDANRKKLQQKRNIRSTKKQTQKRKRIKKTEKRKDLLSKSRSKVVESKRAQKRTTESRKTQKRVTAKKKTLQSRQTAREESAFKSSQDQPIKEQKETLQTSDDGFNKEFGDTGIRKIEEKPEKKKPAEDETEVVVASLPNAPTQTSEESPEVKLTRFSKNITNLKKEIKSSRGNPGALLAKLGDAYLEAQRFMDSQKDENERQKLLDLSGNRDLLLGSYEQAAWAYKLALTFNHQKAETHLKIGKIYDEMEDGINALMFANLAHQIFKRSRNSNQMKETQSFINALTAKYENNSGKKMMPKG